MEEKKSGNAHKVSLESRQKGILSGITDVYAFDEETISLLTDCGKLLIKGEKLHMKSLDLENGQIEIEGKIDSFVYLTKKPKKKGDSFLKHFFR